VQLPIYCSARYKKAPDSVRGLVLRMVSVSQLIHYLQLS